MNWIIDNKEWVFSGIGVFVLAIIWNWLCRRKRASSINQTQTSGTRSNNYQSAGDLSVSNTEKSDD